MALSPDELYNEANDALHTYLDGLQKMNKKAEKRFFRPSMADFDWFMGTALAHIKVAIASAKVIHSSERTIEALERENASLERRIFLLIQENEQQSIKLQAKEEK